MELQKIIEKHKFQLSLNNEINFVGFSPIIEENNDNFLEYYIFVSSGDNLTSDLDYSEIVLVKATKGNNNNLEPGLYLLNKNEQTNNIFEIKTLDDFEIVLKKYNAIMQKKIENSERLFKTMNSLNNEI